MTMQSKNYQLYVFDWDGTVMDTTGLIARGMQQACVTLGYPQPDLDACRETIGLPFAESFARVAPGLRAARRVSDCVPQLVFAARGSG